MIPPIISHLTHGNGGGVVGLDVTVLDGWTGPSYEVNRPSRHRENGGPPVLSDGVYNLSAELS
jgi:hypothetical protein